MTEETDEEKYTRLCAERSAIEHIESPFNACMHKPHCLELKAELDAVLADWNALCRAIGAGANGAAVGEAAMMRRELDERRELMGELRAVLEEEAADGKAS